ncbi:MAG TPA: FHA domain-containing protein, partial [Tepidisphaeraceae bacterium]|nr:FHA domain-containing protein [Tepidisphaeraceae bacterium]
MRPTTNVTNVPSLWLVPISGPTLAPIEIRAKATGQVIGRHEQSDIRLPAGAEQVSRFHARITHDVSGTHITDLGSRGGTFVNGVRIEANQNVALDAGDLVRLLPWMFVVSDSSAAQGQATIADSNASRVRSITLEATAQLEHSLLNLLLESADAIHAAKSYDELTNCVIDAAVRGTGLPNAAVLKPIDNQQHFLVVASRGRSSTEESGYSRSLLEAAARGEPVEISGDFV